MATDNDGWEVITDPAEIQRLRPLIPAKGKGKGAAKPPVAPPTGDMLETQKSRDDARRQLALVDRIQPQLTRARDLYNRSLKGTGLVQSMREYLPSQANAQVDRAFGQLQTLVRPATRTAGEGSMSDFESKLALQSTPSRYSFDSSNEEAFDGLQRLLDSGRATATKQLGRSLPKPPPAAKRAPPREYTIDRDGNIIR